MKRVQQSGPPSHYLRHPWLLALGAALLQLATVLLAGWTWDAILWGAACWGSTLGLAVGVIWSLARACRIR